MLQCGGKHLQLCSSQNTGQQKDLVLTGYFLTVILVGFVENQEGNRYAVTKTNCRELESESSSWSPCCEQLCIFLCKGDLLYVTRRNRTHLV